jgi:hypothetical protein
MTRRRRIRPQGFIITLELILIFTILVIGTLVGVIAVRNALFRLAQAKAQFEVVLGDSSDPQVLIKPVNYDLCETPQILCKDPEDGLFALIGVRPERFTSRDRVYFTGAGCTGAAYVATPGDASLPVGYLNALQNQTYAVGPPSDWPCTFFSTCTSGGVLYRNSTLTPPADDTVPILSVWTSANPDCFLFSNTTDFVDYSDPPQICEDLGAAIDAFDEGLLLAESVDDMGVNVLDKFTPLMSVVVPPNTPVQITPAQPEGAPLVTTGTDLEDAGSEPAATPTDAAPESEPFVVPP